MTRRGPRVLLMACDGTIGNQRREAASASQSKRVERRGVSEQIRDSFSLSLSFSTLQSSPRSPSLLIASLRRSHLTPPPLHHPHPSHSAPSARLPSLSRGAPRWSGCVVPSSQLISPGLVTRSGLEVELWLWPGPVGVVGGGRGMRSRAAAVNLLLRAADRTAFRSSALLFFVFFFRCLERRVARVDALPASVTRVQDVDIWSLFKC